MVFASPLIRTLYRTELRMVLRDRRTIVLSIILPLLVMPLIILASRWTAERREQKLQEMEYQYAVTGPQRDYARALLDATRTRIASQGRGGSEAFSFRDVGTETPARSLQARDIHFFIQCEMPGAARRSGKETAEVEPEEDVRAERSQAGVPVIRIVYLANRDVSAEGAQKMSAALAATRHDRRGAMLSERGFPVPVAGVAPVEESNLASAGQIAGLKLGRMITLMLLLFILSGGAVVATDLIAGEKERGTLETLLTTAADRSAIVAAKHLVILTVALIVTLIQVLNFLVYIGFKLIPSESDFAAAVPPATAVLLLILYLPLAALASSALLMTSGYARTYKEAQLYFYPVILIGIVPALAPFLPGLSLRSAIVVVPIANISVAVKEVLIGTYDWPMIGIAWLTTAAAAWLLARQTERSLSAERLITAATVDVAEHRGGPELFSRHVLRWFAVMWAVVLAASSYMADIRSQLLFNLVIVFLGGSWLMIRSYRLSAKEVWALRPVKPAVWLAVLIGAPSALMAGLGLSKLASLVLPVPQEFLESYVKSMLPEDIPFWQLLLLIAIIPGIIEEIAFRGTLLNGLHRRLHPAALALTVGLIFGLFHFALFRIIPVAFLGIVLTTVTLLTGSVFPAMLWHALNNGIGIVAARYGASGLYYEPWVYAASAIPLALSFWILWRGRTPYPHLRPWRRTR